MGQMSNVRNDVALDTIITNVVIVDAVSGIYKADIGIKDGLIHGIGHAGNPDTMSGVTPGMCVGTGTDVICGEHLICTAGGVDLAATLLQSRHSFMDALAAGITTIFGSFLEIEDSF